MFLLIRKTGTTRKLEIKLVAIPSEHTNPNFWLGGICEKIRVKKPAITTNAFHTIALPAVLNIPEKASSKSKDLVLSEQFLQYEPLKYVTVIANRSTERPKTPVKQRGQT